MNANNVIRDFWLALQKVPGVVPEEWTPREMRNLRVAAAELWADPGGDC